MKTVISRGAIAVVLFGGAWLCWSEARLAARVADAKERMATLQFEIDDTLVPTATVSDYLPGDTRRMSDEIRRSRATVEYWLGSYDDVLAGDNEELDPEVLLTAANAAFRASEREGGGGQVQVQQLDGVLQAYVAVLKAAPRRADAAFNYEYVSRVRDRAASRVPGKAAPAAPPAAALANAPSTRSGQAGDLPAGQTIHGRPGGPPPEMKGEEFEVIAPMQYGDREAQPEATPGGRIQRKG